MSHRGKKARTDWPALLRASAPVIQATAVLLTTIKHLI